MDAKTVFTFAGGMVAGLIIGVLLFSGGPSTSPGVPAPVAPPPQPQVDKIRLQREIDQLEQIVKDEPESYQAWKSLGDKHFDIENPKDSIKSYRKALALNDNSPDVWTDMGIMYRRVGDFTKALEAFDEAMERGPNHALSRFNKGIVYIYDLKEYDKGVAVWEDYLRLESFGQRADAVRRDIEQAKTMIGVKESGGTMPPDHPPIDTSGAPASPGEGDPGSYFPKPDQQ